MSELKLWPWDNEGAKPFFTNPEGMEWWFDTDTTKWAHRKDSNGVTLKNVIAFILRKDEGPLTRVLMNKETNEVIYENPGLEAVACHIDMLKAIKLYDEKE